VPGPTRPAGVPAVIEGLDPRFKQLGLVQLKECDREEEVPFVLCEKSGDGIDEEEPILAPATVDQCPFEEL